MYNPLLLILFLIVLGSAIISALNSVRGTLNALLFHLLRNEAQALHTGYGML